MSATTIDELQVLISANSTAFQNELKKVRGELSSLRTSSSQAEDSMKGFSVAGVAAGTMIGNALMKVASIIASQVTPAISRLDTLNNFPRVMSNLGVSAEASQKSIDYMSEKLKGLPTTLDDAAMSVQRFTSANGNVHASTQMFLALNNAILAGGAPMDIQRSALEQLSQAYAKGKPDMMEWRTLMSAMPAQLKQVATSMNYASSSDLGEALREGKLSMNDFMAQIVRLNHEGYAGFASFDEQARNSTGGVQTSFANLRNAIVRAITDILNVVGQSNISTFFSGIASAINAAVPYVAAFVKVVMMAIGALRTLFGGGKSSPQSATAEIKTNLGDASSGVGNLAGGASDAGKKLGGAAKQAKKLADQLSGFDEMNVLKTPDESSGGSGGSGGGSGGGASATMPDFGNIDTSGLDKIANKAEEIANRIKKYFEEMFDFRKIGNSLKRFWDDLKKGGEPVFKVIADAWERYLKPFISWTGNELLPAFLNALGGAISFVGQVIGKVWDSYLRPFIDVFVVPIANFAGSIIVSVLNGIGDALRGMAENAGVVEMFSNLIAVIATGIAIWQGYQFVLGVVTAAKLALTGVMVAGTTASGAYAAGIGSVTVAQNLAATASSALSGVLSMITNPAFLALAAAATAAVVAMEWLKLRSMEQQLYEQQRIDIVKTSEQAEKWRTEAVAGAAQAIRDLQTAESEATNAELAAINAKQRAELAEREYEKAKNSGTLSAEDLRKKELEMISARGQATVAAEKFKESQNNVNNAIEEHINQKWKEIAAQKQGELAKLQEQGKYEELRRELQELAVSEQTYTDRHGENVKLSKEDTKAMADFIGDQLAKVNDGSGKAWKNIWDAAKNNVDKLKDVSPRVFEAAKSSGSEFGRGIQLGIGSQNQNVYNAGYNQGLQGKKGFNDALKIRSPSRVMMKQSGFFSEGIVKGLAKTTGIVRSATSDLAESMEDSFKPEVPAFDLVDFSQKDYEPKMPAFSGLSANFNHKFEASLNDRLDRLNEKPQQIIVKIGEEKLVDRLIDGINGNSFLRNESLIDL